MNEIPFDAERKRMATIHALDGADRDRLSPVDSRANGAGYVAVVKGAPDLVLERCEYLQTDGGPVPLTSDLRDEILAANAAMASQALRVLAVAYRPLDEVPEQAQPNDLERELVLWLEDDHPHAQVCRNQEGARRRPTHHYGDRGLRGDRCRDRR